MPKASARQPVVEPPGTDTAARGPSVAKASPMEPAVTSAVQATMSAERQGDGGSSHDEEQEASVDVCCDSGVRRDPPCSPQSSTTRSGIGSKGVGWPTR